MNIRSLSDIKSLFFDNKSLKQTVIKNTFWLALAEGVTRILKLFLVIYVARILGVEEYGKFTFALSFVSVFVFFANLGLVELTIREVSKKNDEDFLPIFSLVIVLSSIASLLIFISSFFITSDNNIQKLIWILGFSVLINNLLSLFFSFFRAKQQMEYEFLIKILQSIMVTFVGFFILFNCPSINNLAFGNLFTGLAVLFFTLFLFSSKVSAISFIFDVKKWKNFLILSLPIGVSGIFGLVYNTYGSIVMGKYDQIIQLGWYNASSKIIDIILVLVSIISISFFPILSKFYIESKKRFYKFWNTYFRLTFILSIPLIVGGVVLAPKIIDLIYDPSYSPSILIFQVLILFAGISFISSPLNQVLFIFNQQRKTFALGLIVIIVNVFLTLFLIPTYSLYGLAFIKVITYLLTFALLLWSSLKLTNIKPFNLKFILTLVSVIVSSVVMFLIISIPRIYNLHVLSIVLIGMFIYLLFFLGCQKLTEKLREKILCKINENDFE